MRHGRYNTSLNMLRGARRRSCAVTIGLLVLLINAMAGMMLAGKPIMGLQATNLSAPTNIICTVDGLAIVNDDGTISPLGTASAHPHCVFCLPLMQAQLLPHALPEVAQAERLFTLAKNIFQSTAGSQRHLSGFWARAPPARRSIA